MGTIRSAHLLLLFLLEFIFTGGLCGVIKDVPSRSRRHISMAMKEFRYHEFIVPEVFPQKLSAEKGGYPNTTTVLFSAFSKNFSINLQINSDLFHHRYVEKYFEGEQEVIVKPSMEDLNHCFYHGSIRGATHSIVALSLCNNTISGMFTDDEETYYIEPYENRQHFIARQSDRIAKDEHCGTTVEDDVSFMFPHKHVKLKKRSLQWPYDTNAKTRIVELYVANDFRQYDNYGRDIARVISRTKEIVNIVSSLYRPLNVYVALVGIEIWTNGDQIDVVGNADTTMNNFLEYRRSTITQKHKNDNAQLITGHTFTDGVVGKAVKSTICSWQYSGGVNMDHSIVVGPVGTTVAHEMGHNFGMQHDNHECTCPEDRCIMAASSGGKNPTHWSSCSMDNLADAFHQGLDYCLQNLPDEIYEGPVCGNGFVEDGEDCDCGLLQDCDTPCCNASTCRLTVNSTCATGACCDTRTCQVLPATSVCRSSVGECDLGEYCDGISEMCPTDVYKQTGMTCAAGQRYCYTGLCRDHETQCQLLWGETGHESHPRCYEHFNIMGIANGNCGFNWLDKSFKKCAESDVMCGMLHCSHRNERLRFWKEALAYTMPDGWVMVNGTRMSCDGAILDVGLDMADPGMTPDGTKCGENKMCLNQKCESITNKDIPICPYCNERGVCNSIGQCHCDVGYEPPYCDKVGNGGSLHSGPVKIYSNTSLVLGMVILFLLILSLFAVAAFFSFRYRQKLKKLWNGRPYKYDFLHRAKRSEPPSTASTTPTRPAPPPPGSTPVSHQSFRGMEISGPSLQSTTKTNQSLENMVDVGIQSRALPPPPSANGPRVGHGMPFGSNSNPVGELKMNGPLRSELIPPARPALPSVLQPPPSSSSHPQNNLVSSFPVLTPPDSVAPPSYRSIIPSESPTSPHGSHPPIRPPPTYLEATKPEPPVVPHLNPPPSPPPPPVKKRAPAPKDTHEAPASKKYENVPSSYTPSTQSHVYENQVKPADNKSQAAGRQVGDVQSPPGVNEKKKMFENKPAVPKKGPVVGNKPQVARSNSAAASKNKPDTKANGPTARRAKTSATRPAPSVPKNGPNFKQSDSAGTARTPQGATRSGSTGDNRPSTAPGGRPTTNKTSANPPGRPAPASRTTASSNPKPSVDRARKQSFNSKPATSAKPRPKPSVSVKRPGQTPSNNSADC